MLSAYSSSKKRDFDALSDIDENIPTTVSSDSNK